MSKKRAGDRMGGGGQGNKRSSAPKFRLMLELRHLAKRFPQMAQRFPYTWNLVKLLIALEVVINILVIKNVKYTEIDWSTYMSQVGKIFNGTKFNFNYTQIEGPTGPLVYPAGHVYAFYLLKELTDDGVNILNAQYIYACFYIAQLILVYKIYSHKRTVKVPPYMFIIMCLTSYRIHSIYILRLFNDPIAVLFAYASFYSLLRRKHSLSAFLFSIAISIKMNILLFAPAYALVFYEELGLLKSIKNAAIVLATQLLLAGPFLYTDPAAYFNRAFNFGRVFLHQWTVNWRFLDEKTFTSPEFFKLLLCAHVTLLLLVFLSRWLNTVLKLANCKRYSAMLMASLRVEDPVLTLFIANFVGIACSRSLHYQFYVWYYHSLPMILWATRYSVMVKILILGCIEYAWNQYPSTPFSSSLLHASHVAILFGLFTGHYMRQINYLRKETPASGRKTKSGQQKLR